MPRRYEPVDLSVDPTARALLAEVIARPADDEPRLVIADWLLERSDPRGELIALQCRASSEHDNRITELLKKHQGAWVRAFHVPRAIWDFRRGFIAHGRLDAIGAAAVLDELFRREPIEALSIRGLKTSGAETAAITLGKILAHPALARLRSLSLAQNRLNKEASEALAQAQHFGALEALDLESCALSIASATRLAVSPALSNLRRLSLAFNAIEDRGTEAFARSPHLSQLEELSLQALGLTDASMRALRESRSLDRLRRVLTANPRIRAEGIETLLGAPFAPSLESLSLFMAHDQEPIAAIVAGNAERLAALRFFDFGYVREADVTAVLEFARLPALEKLRLAFHYTLDRSHVETIRARFGNRLQPL